MIDHGQYIERMLVLKSAILLYLCYYTLVYFFTLCKYGMHKVEEHKHQYMCSTFTIIRCLYHSHCVPEAITKAYYLSPLGIF